MAKTKSAFFCSNCGYESPKWLGKCPACNEWNTFLEEKVSVKKGKKETRTGRTKVSTPKPINEILVERVKRIDTGDKELNRVLGGGIVPGSLVLVAGEPGIGKSTLLLQTAVRHQNARVLYISGEESLEQVSQRAGRIGNSNENCFVLSVTDPDVIAEEAEKLNPDFIVVDSIQTLHADWLESSPGSISQVKEGTASLMRFAKESGISIFLIGHITKEGSIAGPKVLEHMVDTVTVFEGDQHNLFRLLRTTKNRFGSTNELGIYRMEKDGLEPVDNPSELLLNRKAEMMSGTAASTIVEGVRPLVVEVQALVSSAVYGTPQRSATGFDLRRLNMLLAVLEKRCGFRLGAKDVFLNIAGGIKVNDPAIDLAVAAAILSSSEDISLPSDTCFAAEIGLSGEIRPVTRIEQRISEAEKLGFTRIFISKHHALKKKSSFKIDVAGVSKIQEMLTRIFA